MCCPEGYWRKGYVDIVCARIAIPQQRLQDLGLKLTPGMPVEAFIRTEDRTVVSYLTKPLGDQIAKAFRER